jgi:hypothetical protein
MSPRTVRRWVVAGLAAAAVALGIFGAMSSAGASDIEWHMPANQTIVR